MNIKKQIIIISSIFSLIGCSSFAPFGSETAVKYLGIAKGITDATTYSVTGKTTNDHILSAAFGKDCKLTRIIVKKPICIEFDAKTYRYSIFNKGKVVSKNKQDYVIRRLTFNPMFNEMMEDIFEFLKNINKDKGES